jgi:MSHA biogenesis protein MshE
MSQTEPIKIGQILVEQGILSDQQVFEILETQKRSGVPFGVLAERLFDVTVESIEHAWVEQYARFTGTVDLEQLEVDKEALKLINRRQAWQFEILPLRIEPHGQVVIAASRDRLARAVTFVARRIEPVAYFRIAESDQLRAFLREHYPMPEIASELFTRARKLAG